MGGGEKKRSLVVGGGVKSNAKKSVCWGRGNNEVKGGNNYMSWSITLENQNTRGGYLLGPGGIILRKGVRQGARVWNSKEHKVCHESHTSGGG